MNNSRLGHPNVRMSRQHWNEHIGNIFQVYSRSDRKDLIAGMCAYQNYHDTMRKIAKRFGVHDRVVMGCFAALSPNNDYNGNLKDTETVISTFLDGKSVESANVTTYKPNRTKAWSICQGEAPLDVLGGKKVRSFYQNIVDPDDEVPVTIDGHMYSVWMLQRFNMSDAKVGSGKQYDIIADDYRAVAKTLGVLPNVLQATCWFTWKRINLIRFDKKELQHNLVFA